MKMTKDISDIRNTSKMKIDQNFLPVKFALFCWYAGSLTSSAFLPVFLKYQGLTITYFSIFTGISVCIQFLGGFVSAFVADKIGRIKPFLFFFFAIYWMTCLAFIALPSVSECNVDNASFLCNNEKVFNFTATFCKTIQNHPRVLQCSKITVENGKNHVDQSNESRLFVTLFPKFDLNSEMKKRNNISGLYSSTLDCVNCSFESISSCISESCKSLQMDCSVHLLHCNNTIFWIVIYGVLIVLYSLARTNVFRFLDVIVSDLTSKCNSDFGRQRVYAILGGMAGPLLAGIILNKINGPNSNEQSYTWAFVCAIIFSVLSALCMGKVDPKFHKPASKMWKKSFELVKNLDIILFFALLITMGSVAGFRSLYRNWYLKELGASDLLTGCVSSVGNLYGIPFLYNSKWCINKFGIRNVFLLGLLGHVVYSFSFSAMRDPWIALIIESTNILAYHLFWVAVIQYCDILAPDGLIAILKVLAGSLHFNIGRLISSFIGGYVMNTYGGKAAFAVLGFIASAFMFVYGSHLIIHHLRQRKARNPLNSVYNKEIPVNDQSLT